MLFGSYAYGQPHEDSDIDILLVTNDDFMPKTYEELLEYRLRYRRQVRDIAMQVPLDLLIYSRPLFERFKQLNTSFAEEILSKGIKLYEGRNTRMAQVRQ